MAVCGFSFSPPSWFEAYIKKHPHPFYGWGYNLVGAIHESTESN